MGSYQQILAGTSLTVTETFSVDGAAIDTDTALPTLTLTKPDGTASTPTPTVSNSWTGRTTGQYRFVLPAQPDPYYLDSALAGVIGGQPLTLHGRVEWVGYLGHLFNIDQFRLMRVAGSQPFTSTSTYPNSDIQEARAEVLDEFCQILGFSPIPRYYREVVSAADRRGVALKKERYPTKLLSVTVSGVAAPTSGFVIGEGGTVDPVSNYAASSWPAYGYRNVVVEYVGGLDRVPGRGRNAAMLMVGQALNPAGFSSASTVSLPTGESYSYEPAETGRWGFQRHTGVKELDRWLNRWAPPRLGVA